MGDKRNFLCRTVNCVIRADVHLENGLFIERLQRVSRRGQRKWKGLKCLLSTWRFIKLGFLSEAVFPVSPPTLRRHDDEDTIQFIKICFPFRWLLQFINHSQRGARAARDRCASCPVNAVQQLKLQNHLLLYHTTRHPAAPTTSDTFRHSLHYL